MQPTLQPTYVAHPANLEAEETFAIVFKGSDDKGWLTDTDLASDAETTARLLVWLGASKWLNAFEDSLARARRDLEAVDYDDLEHFLGGPAPTARVEMPTATHDFGGWSEPMR